MFFINGVMSVTIVPAPLLDISLLLYHLTDKGMDKKSSGISISSG